MKALKRTMAGEYSRELGVKVLAGQRRLACLGFKQGGRPGYGLRRLLVSPDRLPKQQLADGERKSLATDRVILVPGPATEVKAVRDIYQMLVRDGLSVYTIARELNRQGIKYTDNSDWDYQAVYGVLTQPKYAGYHVYGRTSGRLYTPTVKLPPSEWIVRPYAFEPVIDYATFAQAQLVLHRRTINQSDDQLLASLRALLAREGRLSLHLIKNSPEMPSPSTYRHRFGSLRRAYELIGYGHPDQFGPIDLRRRTQALLEELIAQIVAMLPRDASVARRGGRWRSRLRLKGGLMVSVLIARSVHVWKQTVRWQIDPVRHERGLVTLVARLDGANREFLDFHLFPGMDRTRRFVLSVNDPWLERGRQLELHDFCQVSNMYASSVTQSGRGKP